MASPTATNIMFVARHYSGGYTDNLSQKLDSQIAGARASGFATTHFELSEGGLARVSDIAPHRVVYKTLRRPTSSMRKVLHYLSLYRVARQCLPSQPPDLVYVRSAPPVPGYLRFLREARLAGSRVIVEIPTHPSAGETNGRPLLQRTMHRLVRLGRTIERRYVNLYTVIGEDVRGSFRGRPAMNINNGIDVTSVTLRTPSPQPETLRLFGLASMCTWHGYDRVIKAIAAKEPNERPTFYLAGPDGDGSRKQWSELAKQLNVTDHVKFLGEVRGEELDTLINMCDVAIGSLGLHRIGLESASTLKSREYMARGMPFIYATHDPTLEGDPPGCMRIDGDDSEVSIAAIQRFHFDASRQTELQHTMRRFAAEHFSWDSTMLQIVEAADVGNAGMGTTAPALG